MQGILKKISYIAFLIIVIICSLFSSCSTMEATSTPKKVLITLINGNYMTEQQSYRLDYGTDLSIKLRFEEGFTFGGCNYGDYTIIQNEDNTVDLILKNVKYSQRIKISVQETKSGVYYYLNGGEFISEGYSSDYYIQKYSLVNHVRANTEIGMDKIRREGYVLTGWNTKADGSGEHIGLGSRVTLKEGKYLDLYAEWAKCIEVSTVEYEEVEGGVQLKKYLGDKNVDPFVLPYSIGGKPVTLVASGFAEGLRAKTLVIPSTMDKLEAKAFTDCAFEEVYFFDTLRIYNSLAIQGETVRTWHINAVRKPCYQSSNANAQFADNIDRLILSQGKKKMIFFAGCSMSYGLNSKTVEETFGGEYVVCNTGVIGGTDAGFQFDILSQFVEEGDIFIHAPEVSSQFQFMAKREVDQRLFVMVEGNYDLLSLVDVSTLPKIFSAYEQFSKSRNEMEEGSYDDTTRLYNEYGDYIEKRVFTGVDKKFSIDGEEYSYDMDLAEEQSLQALFQKYELFKEKGVSVLFSFSPVNYHGLTSYMQENRMWQVFEDKIKKGFEHTEYRVISKASDYVFEGKYFYDEDYHLNDYGAKLRTQRLIRDIQKSMGQE